MKFKQIPGLLVVSLLLCTSYSVGQAASPFAPLEQWKTAITTGNATALRGLYSTNPQPQIKTVSGPSSADAEIAFWMGLKVRSMKLNVTRSDSPQAGVQQLVFEAEIHPPVGSGEHVRYVREGQLWQQQGGAWKLVAAQRTDPTRLEQPTTTDKIIYPTRDAHTEIKDALALAARQNKNVLVVFGADWCYDCHVLDLAFHRSDVAGVLNRNYEVVHIDVGEGDKNQDIMEQYHVPMKKGIPALAVLNSSGKLLFSQQGGEFEKARSLAPEDILAFLNKWKPQKS